MTTVRTGLENLLTTPPAGLQHKRLGLLCNPASINSGFEHARTLIARHFPGCLRALYSPQHGFWAEKQDNMVESAGFMDPELKIPIYSLYGETRWPTPGMFDPIDVLLVDLQDVGTRVYTFIYTMAHCMEAAARMGKSVLVLDRPNPIGGDLMEGNLLEPAAASFVGRYPIPMRHGMTIAELAHLFNEVFAIRCDLSVMAMTGWKRGMWFKDTGLAWVPPSPNLPTPDSAMVYPGQVIWEGTNVSEGRGTTLPFELVGAPYFDPKKIIHTLKDTPLAGVVLRETAFEPTANKWTGRLCRGFQLHVVDPVSFRPYETSLALLWAVLRIHPDAFCWKKPPYEYEHERLPMDLILGSPALRESLESGTHPSVLAEQWKPDLEVFAAQRSECLLYR